MATTSYSYDCATTVALPVRATCSVSPRPRAAAWAPPPTATTPSARPSTSSTAGAAHTAPPTTPTAGPPTSLYDALGNLARTVTNSYDPDGFLTGRTDTAGGTSTTTGYSTDAYSRSTAKLDPGAGPVSCSDADNRGLLRGPDRAAVPLRPGREPALQLRQWRDLDLPLRHGQPACQLHRRPAQGAVMDVPGWRS